MESSEHSTTTLIHFGDLHLWRLGLDGDLFPKRLLGLGNLWLRRSRKFPESVARAVVERLAGETADALAFSGDLATTALAGEFAAGRRLFQPLFERWGERLIVIPGNHDRYTPRAAQKRLFESLFLRREQTYPFAVDLDDRWTLVGFDCSVPRWITSTGRADTALREALEAELRRQRQRGREVAVMGHYPLVYPAGVSASWDHALAEAERRALLEVLKRCEVRLFLHGHNHRRWALAADGVVHLNCGSAGMDGRGEDCRPGYLKIRLGEAGAVHVEGHWMSPDGVGSQGWRSQALTVAAV